MNLYTQDLALFGFADFSDPIIDPVTLSHHHLSSSPTSPSIHRTTGHRAEAESSDDEEEEEKKSSLVPRPKSPPHHRHDGTSPLPLGMDWSLPPGKWDGRDTIWPHDPHTGWSYCVTIPSWILLPKSRGSDPVAFYRVQVGVQSPAGITTIRGVLRRYSDFLKLVSDLRKAFPEKNLPPAPSRRILRIKSRSTLLEERQCALEDWMEKLLSDIEISRSAAVGTFLELEAAARSYFEGVNQQNSDANSFVSGMVSSVLHQSHSDVSLLAGSSLVVSDHGNHSQDGMSDIGTPRHESDDNVELGMETSTSEPNITFPTGMANKYGLFKRQNILENIGMLANWKLHSRRKEHITSNDKFGAHLPIEKSSIWDETQSLPELEYQRLDGHVRKLSTESIRSDLNSVRASEITNLTVGNLLGHDALDLLEGDETYKVIDAPGGLNRQLLRESLVVFPSEERQKLSSVLSTVQQRLATAKTDMEDLLARLNQEIAMRQFLATKVKDLEVDLETTRNNCRDSVEQAILMEKEKFTQMQWDIEEHHQQCLELELKLKSEQEEKARAEAAKVSIINENKLLLHQLDIARDELRKLHKEHEELELKSKADVKLLVKEVKSLRTYQSELKQELGRLMKEKLEVESVLLKEKQRTEHVCAANAKLLHECDILRNRLQECSVNFLSEEEDRLIVDTSSPSDAIDILTTSDNRIGLLLAEAQLLAQDIENSVAKLDESCSTSDGDSDDERLRKMLTEIFIDNARLRMQVNSVIRYALSTLVKSDQDDDDEEESPLRKTVLSKFLER